MLNVSELRQILDSGGWATVTSGLYAPAAGAGGSGSFGRVVHVFASVDSTNSRARDLAMKGAPGGTVVMAREQTAGRGRHGRVWESEPGKNLLFSIVLRPRVEPELLGLVSLYASVSVAACVEELCGRDAGCKWPNDVTVSGRKICGILSESVITPGGVDAV
ncbi:MAG TPA: biotin--[acetyl-CoA-carboxylase] ligase, partial [Bacteroidota bacterium]|nr:biotin--[acetyl-CoA-carboxylase] ligase [Bacteroidota bacterium]